MASLPLFMGISTRIDGHISKGGIQSADERVCTNPHPCAGSTGCDATGWKSYHSRWRVCVVSSCPVPRSGAVSKSPSTRVMVVVRHRGTPHIAPGCHERKAFPYRCTRSKCGQNLTPAPDGCASRPFTRSRLSAGIPGANRHEAMREAVSRSRSGCAAIACARMHPDRGDSHVHQTNIRFGRLLRALPSRHRASPIPLPRALGRVLSRRG
jgi:hypothetical protein